ncbi:DUF4136 domain-containing protein [Pollutimonas sp. M17]|jgi:TolB-like protein|uniref:DUF4136 domain-containing protein n=1 Tax=Pollutimonas sp. M17 TaxID=2962065 RepID=UPI0021F4A33B|nr:DUF4136 domain-containing protein [Pollutimonas sp. M17]UYO93592.1 DUF4136 domain-containing protein [Pollutimonas sp. M17]
MKTQFKARFNRVAGITALVALAACSSTQVSQAPSWTQLNKLALVPLSNYTETPGAALGAQSIAQNLLHQKGFTQLATYPFSDSAGTYLLNNTDQQRAQALEWARNAGAQYALTGAVQEWRYKVGIDGEPVVGLSFDVVDLNTGEVVWSAMGSRSGWSRSTLAGVGHELISQLLEPIQP